MGKNLRATRNIIGVINGYLEELDKSHYKVGIIALKRRYEKCISLRVDFVEK